VNFVDRVAAIRDVLNSHGLTHVPADVLIDLAKATPGYEEYWTDEEVAVYVDSIRPGSVRTWAFKNRVPRVRMMPAAEVRRVADAHALARRDPVQRPQ
jgi:hypothetical protein